MTELRSRRGARSALARLSPMLNPAAALAALAVLGAAPRTAEGRITRVEITRVESPAFEGASFGLVGQYEKLVGRAYGEVDPGDRRNAVIVDLALAPRNARGMVEYSTDIYILRPIVRANGNGRLFFEVNNRGNKLAFGALHDISSGNDPTTAADAGNGFLMRKGFTIAWAGWDALAAPGGGRMTITVPVAHNPDGSAIVGPSMDEFVIDNNTTTSVTLTYPAATLDQAGTTLTYRNHYADPPISIPSSGWEFIGPTRIRLAGGAKFLQGHLYEFTYQAINPIVAGLGFAATRDVAAFFHRAATDDLGAANPLAGDVRYVHAFTISQPARWLRDYVHLGFNEDEGGQVVFDGILNYIGGGNGGFNNFRFAQTARTARQHIGRRFPEGEFPFANQITYDPITGRTDGRLRRCLATGTCPKIYEVNSANEYWVKASSLLHTDTSGNDLSDPDNVRFYLLSSMPHSAGAGTNTPGICAQPRNPIAPNPALRAFVVTLDDWVSGRRRPPPSRVPRRADGTFARTLPQSELGFPSIPGVTYLGIYSERALYDFGPQFDEGIITVWPPRYAGPIYPSFVPRTDADGIDIAGVKLPEIAVPFATYTGWATRADAYGGPDLCDASGQQIPFARTRAERLATGDPRLSIEERYPTHGAYVSALAQAVNRLKQERFLLEEDAQRYLTEGAQGSVGKPAEESAGIDAAIW